MSKLVRETRARIADAYGNRFIKDRVFHCICTFMRFVNKLRGNYGFGRDNKGRMQGSFIYRDGIYNSCSYCDEMTTCNGLVVALVPSCQYGFTRC